MTKMSDMRTPLGRVRGLGSAKEGTDHFWLIRLSAIALVPLAFFVIGWIVSLRGADSAQIKASLSYPPTTFVVGLFVLISLYHMRLGMQLIIEDYAHNELNKLVLLILNTFFTILIGAASLFALLKIAFGG
ncbi:succinate dehydrogenase, hydrophobic membrane anchor protein [Mesorhizobium sp. YM1C-6-2]|uniref:succinate dehydrogenase, hydrophobic membrane anchor protein n=1 Tax=Mesorhizobium sp. YM1C-6-2 TaxID=1827501 RepID=UPI0015FFE389|nr:succinate dehydrogenase, hydrophobic membrane anchor protein [Mesorhizobium sp. YM1C-6-2]